MRGGGEGCKNVMSSKDIDAYIDKQKVKATKYKDVSDHKTFKWFCKTISEHHEIYKLFQHGLDNILCQFFIKSTRNKGKLYEPDTLTEIRKFLRRVLSESGSKLTFMKVYNLQSPKRYWRQLSYVGQPVEPSKWFITEKYKNGTKNYKGVISC